MQKFEWMESLSVGVPTIDAQHRELIAAFNDLSNAIEQGNGAAAVKKLMISLQYLIEWYLEHEENCADKHACAIAERHRQGQVQLSKMLKNLQAQYCASGASDEIARSAHARLADWLVSSVMIIDASVAPCVLKSATPVAVS